MVSEIDCFRDLRDLFRDATKSWVKRNYGETIQKLARTIDYTETLIKYLKAIHEENEDGRSANKLSGSETGGPGDLPELHFPSEDNSEGNEKGDN